MAATKSVNLDLMVGSALARGYAATHGNSSLAEDSVGNSGDSHQIQLNDLRNETMTQFDSAIPILPSRSVEQTCSFYRQLGFESDVWGTPNHYAILTRGSLEIHFFSHPQLEPTESIAGCYLRVRDVAEIFAAFAQANLPAIGIPRLEPVENKPWGMREFALVDSDGNLLRVGQEIEDHSPATP